MRLTKELETKTKEEPSLHQSVEEVAWNLGKMHDVCTAAFYRPWKPKGAAQWVSKIFKADWTDTQRPRRTGDMLHVDQEQDPTRMLERALNGARSCNHSSKPRAVVHRVIRDDVRVCQRDSSRSIDRTQLQCCRRERCVSVVEVIGKL